MKSIIRPSIFIFVLVATTAIAKDELSPWKRTKKLKVYCDTGTLTHYAGNKWLTAEIRLPNGEKREYYRTGPDLLDGNGYPCCTNPPDGCCPDWPKNIVVGKTKVRVEYWWGQFRGGKTRITDRIYTIASQGAVSSTVKRSDIMKFIPKGYVVFDTVYGDLNKDSIEDCIVMIKGTSKKGIVKDRDGNDVDRNRRGILVLFNKNGDYELALKNYNCFSSENEDGGVYYSPELSLEIRKGNLYVHYDHGRYGYWQYTFRYQNSDLELIGFDVGDMNGPTLISLTSINYVTKKKIIEKNVSWGKDEESEDVFEKTETKIKVTKLHRLSIIKDFDELGDELVDD